MGFMTLWYIWIYLAYHFILLWSISSYGLIPYRDWEGWGSEHSVSKLWICLSPEGARRFPDPGYLSSRMELSDYGIFDKCGYTWFAILSCYGSIAVSYGKDGCLSTFYHSCRFACQQKLLKTFPGSAGYLHSEDGIV